MTKQVYDEEWTFHFAKQVRLYKRKLPKNKANIEDSKQVVRASGSVGANYIEANESLSKKDFLQSLKNQNSVFRIWNFVIVYYLFFGICFLEFLPNNARISDIRY